MSDWWQSIVWGSPHWRVPSLVLAGLAAVAVLASYSAIRGPQHVRWAAALLKALAIATLVVVLIEPMRSEERPRPGANLFVVLADNSASVSVKDRGGQSIQSKIEAVLSDTDWQSRLGQDFDVRRYQFDNQLQAVGDWEAMSYDGEQTALAGALESIHQRFEGQPLAGVLLLSDGNATDEVESWLENRGATAPIHTVTFPTSAAAVDAAFRRVSIRQTNFEDAPVTITADVTATGFAENAEFEVRLLDQKNTEVDKAKVRVSEGQMAPVELTARPQTAGAPFFKSSKLLHVYRLELKPVESKQESTLANNQRLVLVQREDGPHRMLYVSGRPNWEFKFLHRAMEEDEEIDLVGLVRIARKEPKFVFRDRDAGSTNQLFEGFDGKDADDTEQYDQPVLIRMGIEDDNPDELRGGFPKDRETLFGFQAIILDDLESGFFDEDQLALIKDFVSQRGGGLLMLGGAGSFQSGRYARTPLGDMLPVYLKEGQPDDSPSSNRYQLQLSREGWLQPWMRMRSSEAAERKRMEQMPLFDTLNRIERIKPGATTLAKVNVLARSAGGFRHDGELPALVSQRYGKGQVAALMIGDFWKWGMLRDVGEQRDLDKAWRQLMRWLISESPQRVEASAKLQPSGRGVDIEVNVRDQGYRALDNAELEVTVTTPDLRTIALPTTQSTRPGVYTAEFQHRETGPYLIQATAKAADGEALGRAESGWTHEPSAKEFESLAPNTQLLAKLSASTKGTAAPVDALKSAVAKMAQQKAVVNEKRMTPLWHRWYVFLFAALCLAGEWGLRRWHGLP